MRLTQWTKPSRSLTKYEVDVFYNAPLQSARLFVFKTKFMEVPTHKGAFSLKMVVSGAEDYRLGNRTARVTPGQILLVNDGETYSSLINQETESVSIFLPAVESKAILESFSMAADFEEKRQSTPFTDFDVPQSVFPADGDAKSIAKKMISAVRAEDPSSAQEYSRLLFMRALGTLTGFQSQRLDGQFAKKSTRDELLQRLLRAKAAIDDSQGQYSDLDELAAISCLSKYYFLRLFTETFAMSPASYARRIRLMTAKCSIENGGNPNRAARRAGYTNQQSFRRAIRRHT